MIEFHLDGHSKVATYMQLVQQVKQSLRTGVLGPGDQLPKVREVSGALAINPNTVLKAYRQLENEGLVEGREGSGRRLLQLTEEGRAYVESHPEELAATWRPFEGGDPEEGPGDLKPVIGQVMGAVWQVVVSGTKQQKAEAAEILSDTRRRLYGILAEGDPEQDGPAGTTAS